MILPGQMVHIIRLVYFLFESIMSSIDPIRDLLSPRVPGRRFIGSIDGFTSNENLAHNQSSVTGSQPGSNLTSGQLTSISNKPKKREVYRYQADWLVSSVAWSNETRNGFDLALASYRENYKNYVQLVRLDKDSYNEELHCISTFEHPYPATKVLWIPKDTQGQGIIPQLLATTADYLRIWRVNQSSQTQNQSQTQNCDSDGSQELGVEVNLECLLNASQGAKYCAPLTSFDWNEIDPSLIVTSSVDTTCAIWDIETKKLTDSISTLDTKTTSGKLRSQLVAHDHQVYDISFSRLSGGRDVFVTAGGDGSIRQFDLRFLRTSTVLYEDHDRISMSHDRKAFVRVACCKKDENLVASFAMDSNDIILLDVRSPGKVLTRLSNRSDNLNSISWAPHSGHHICSAGDDQQALIWELKKLPEPIEEPLLAYKANGKINVISWSGSRPDWIAIGYENYLELLRV